MSRVKPPKQYFFLRSIRAFLLVNLLAAIGMMTLLTAMGNYYIEQKDIQEHVNSSIILAGHTQASDELRSHIVRDEMALILLIFPFSGILIWLIIGRGLRSLKKVTQEVAHRAAGHLEPVYVEFVPEEMSPLVDELNHLFLRLKEGFEREQRFAADAAHELRTPLAAIKAQAQVALNASNNAEKDAALAKLITCVNRSTHIVQQLLTMSKLSPNSHEVDIPETIHLSRIARDILTMLAPAALEKNIELELDESAPNIVIRGNATAIGILLRNLVDNAIRYSPEQALVVVRIHKQSQSVVLEIEDQGPGIPNELRARVFERFFRILGTKPTGSGLGLAIVQQICNMHHAKIQLDSPQHGDGLLVRIEFASA
jgi:two-component system sensor histidine kinase QseC